MRRSSSLHSIDTFVERKISNDKYQDVVVVSGNIDDIVNTSEHIADIQEVNSNIANIDIVATDIDNVNTIGANITDVSTVAANIADVVDVSNQIIPNLPEILLADDNAVLVTNLYDQFDDRFLGAKDADPLVDNDGDLLMEGAIYWNTVLEPPRFRAYSSIEGWQDALTLSTNGEATLTNKIIDDFSNSIGADHIHYKVRNDSDSIIPVNTVVTASGTQPGTDYLSVVPLTDNQTQVAIGIIHTELAKNGVGLVVNTGVINNIDTDTDEWDENTILYADSNGWFTDIKPTGNQYQACGIVLRRHASHGTILVEFTEPTYYASTGQAGYVELVNNLTTDDITKVVTATQSKALKDAQDLHDSRISDIENSYGQPNGYAPLNASGVMSTQYLTDNIGIAPNYTALGVTWFDTNFKALKLYNGQEWEVVHFTRFSPIISYDPQNYSQTPSGDAVILNSGSTETTNDLLLHSGRGIELTTESVDIPIHHTLGADDKKLATSVDTGWTDNLDNTYTGAIVTGDIVGLSTSSTGTFKVTITLSSVTGGDVEGYTVDGTYVFEETLSASLNLTGTGFTGVIEVISVEEITNQNSYLTYYDLTAKEFVYIDNSENTPSTTYHLTDGTYNNILTHTTNWSATDKAMIEANPNLVGKLALSGTGTISEVGLELVESDAWYPAMEKEGDILYDARSTGTATIVDYAQTVRNNADFQTAGIQTTTFVRDALGVPQSYDDTALNWGDDGYGDTQWVPDLSNGFILEMVQYFDNETDTHQLSGTGAASPNTFFIGQNYNPPHVVRVDISDGTFSSPSYLEGPQFISIIVNNSTFIPIVTGSEYTPVPFTDIAIENTFFIGYLNGYPQFSINNKIDYFNVRAISGNYDQEDAINYYALNKTTRYIYPDLNISLYPNLTVQKNGNTYSTNISADRLFSDDDADKVVYVDITIGDDTTGDGSIGNPYKTIYKGVRESGFSKLTVYIKSGTYIDADGFNGTGIYADEINIIGTDGYVTSIQTNDSANNFALINDKKYYMENIVFDGGIRPISGNYSGSGMEVRAKNCTFRNGIENGVNIYKNGLYIFEECTAEYNGLDGFNYHNSDTIKNQLVIEINCIGRYNGIGGTANNGSTIHDAGNIVRLNCQYYNNGNRNIHDINNSRSWNLGVICSDGQEVGEANFACGLNDSDETIMWLDGCVSNGSNNKDFMYYGAISPSSRGYAVNFTKNGGIPGDNTILYIP